MQTETMGNPENAMPAFQNRSREIVKFKDQNEVVGTFTGTREREVTDRDTGELKTITDICLDEYGSNRKIAVARDAGLRVAFSSADVKEGELVKIVKEGQTDLGGGKRVNNYNVMVAQ